MSVIVTGMDMPKSCCDCGFCNYHDGDDYCSLFKNLYNAEWTTEDVTWDNSCPLKSVDGLIDKIETYWKRCEVILEVPTFHRIEEIIKEYCEVENV